MANGQLEKRKAQKKMENFCIFCTLCLKYLWSHAICGLLLVHRVSVWAVCLSVCPFDCPFGWQATVLAAVSGRWSYLVWPARAKRRPVKRRVCQSVKYAANALIAMAIEFMWQTSLTPTPSSSPSWFWFRSWYLVSGYSALGTCFSGCSSSCSLPMVSHRCSNLKQLLRPKLDMCPALSLIVFPLQHLNFALGQ